MILKWFERNPNIFKVPQWNLALSTLYGTLSNSIELEQTPQNAASNQILHCLLAECTYKI